MSFSPVAASKHIKEKYYRYLKTSFRMSEPYQEEFERLVDTQGLFASGPFLDVTDAFSKGKNISDLIDEGILPRSFFRIGINQTRPLYRHQEISARKIIVEKRNLVVSTGTGSGKTECFMIPVLQELTTEAETGKLCPGVRTLLIYPTNALANDQTERLRKMLANYQEITFGVYTGQTKQKTSDALVEYKSLNHNQDPNRNELISRDQMIENPPHILITNYAMLEYLMLRPRDSVFFDGETAKYWKFIVFDEAHVYTGSTGIEVSMLFRRLQAKLGGKKITYILTSATLGGEKDDIQVAEFARKLCNAPFDRSDIVRADRIVPRTDREPSALPIQFYEKIAKAQNENKSDDEIMQILGETIASDLKDVLYERIVHDNNYWTVRTLLDKPQTISFIAEKMGWNEKQLADFVSVASLAQRDGGKLFDARYHMFLRAAESVFVTLAPNNRVLLHRANYRDQDQESFKVFEAAVCSYCNAVYLVGKIKGNKFEQYNQSDDLSRKELLLLASAASDTDSDHILKDEGINADAYMICPYCGFICKDGSTGHCEHDQSKYVRVYRVRFGGERRILTKCLKCENINISGVLRMFFSGQEASTSVIGTALFEELPSYKITSRKRETKADDLGDKFGYDDEVKKKKAKQFIAFSDSRQAAAFYASYLNISYNSILYKRLITATLNRINADSYYTVPEFADLLQREFEVYQISGKKSFDDDAADHVKKESWKAILSELVDNNETTSLTNFGLLGIDLNVRGSYEKFNITESEFKDLCSVFAMSMMANAAIRHDALNEKDLDDFTHDGKVYSYTCSDACAKKFRKAFIPTKSGLSNKRVDYLQKILQKKGKPLSNDEAAEFLKKLWNKVLIEQKILYPVKGNSYIYSIDTDKVQIYRPFHWYVCEKCQRLTCHNVANVCPTYHCDGVLVEIDPSKKFFDNHYYRLYREMEPCDLRVVEHTAQLDRETAYKYQKQFKQKEIDVLSCSTTFEMGVDVGNLETVFMRNVPPSPSNYAQRAGRAGRNSQSAAYALTFCNKSSHDFYYFKDPSKMIQGKIDPPKYTIENERIAIRHLYAAAFGYFFRIHPEYFKSIGKFLNPDQSGQTGLEHLKTYIQSQPDDLKQYLINFLPEVLCNKFKVNEFGWSDSLIGEKGVLTEAAKIYQYEVSLLEEAKRQRLEKKSSVDGITQRIRAYRTENILAFLSRKNIIPKYGFPVDTVEMVIFNNKDRTSPGLQLQRDLSMAISEYAPGSQIVANNNLITSRYIRKVPNIKWKMYCYVQCEFCKTLNIEPYTEGDDDNSTIVECCQCHKKFTSSSAKVFLIPEYGFIADGNKIRKPGLKKPERTYRGEISYVGFKNYFKENHYNVGKAIVEVKTSHDDEMAILNTSPFYVCEICGYAEVDEKMYTCCKNKEHKNAGGFSCNNKKLRQFSLGYRFRTDVVRIRFENYEINDYKEGLSILYGFMRGACAYLNIEENDISGCLQSNPIDGRLNYAIVIFDSTPGGAGHAKRLDDKNVLYGVLRLTLELMEKCSCGGKDGDSSCYSCLRNYRNQRYHDDLKRKYVTEFIENILK